MDISKTHLHWRVSHYNGKSYKSYSLARSVRVDGKNRKEILLPLGKLTDQEADKWRKVLQQLKGKGGSASIHDIIVNANYAYLDVAVALEIWKFWNLDAVFNRPGNRQVSLAAVAAALTINRCIDPMSKVRVPAWFKQTALPFLLGVDSEQMNSSRIFRELTEIEGLKTELYDHLYKEHLERDPESMKSVFYDLTTTTFSGNKCLLMKWGHCKEGYENHVVLALVVNEKALPVYWAVLSGNTADATTIDWLLRSLGERFKIATPTIVFDRGMVSDTNLALLESEAIKYISAMDKNQLEALSEIDFGAMISSSREETEQKLLGSGLFKKHNETLYHEESPKDGIRRYVLCFNPQLFEDQRNAREESLLRYADLVKGINKELLKATKGRDSKSSLKKFEQAAAKCHVNGFVSVTLKEKNVTCQTEDGGRKVLTYQGTIEIDEQKKAAAGRLDGFWMLVTNHMDKIQFDSAKLIQAYKDKVVIESSFRDIKSFIDVAPVHVWTIDHVKAHYTICVLAYLIDRTLSLALAREKGECSEEIVSHVGLFDELSQCRLNHVEVKGSKESALSLTRPTSIQKDLLKRIGLTRILEEGKIKELCLAAR